MMLKEKRMKNLSEKKKKLANTRNFIAMQCDAMRCDAMRCDAMRCNDAVEKGGSKNFTR